MNAAMGLACGLTPGFDQVSIEQWQRLESARLFFGHQSVGGDLIQGVREVLSRNSQIPVRVVETSDPAAMKEPGLYHARIGRNGAPESKLDAFGRVAASLGSGTAMLKYCYADVTANTDPAALFEAYCAGVETLRSAHPGLTIVHVTIPLVADHGTLRHVAAVVRGRPTYRQVNWLRAQYNELLRATYGGREAIFDLAELESTKAGGGRATVRYRGDAVPVLASEWTYDGGHLNEAGRRRMAEVFLATLATL
jgi:hypothetical protein